MRRWLWTILAASLLVYPFAAGAADYGSSSTGTGSGPPVAQTLVREGDFAIKLAAVLDIGTPSTEEGAEDLLVKAGIAPLNGWLSDYPVTAQILGQLQESISGAASQGKLQMTSDQAVKGLYSVAAQYNLPTPSGQGSAASAEAPPQGASQYQPDQQAVDTYYYDAGPPVVTYYPPPYDYAYLYDWVPYPVWWFGFWFPGYYICNSFTTVIIVHSRPVVVSNHFVDHRTGAVVTVDPVARWGPTGGRPRTVLRTERGRGYLTLADLRHGVPVAGLSGGRRERGMGREAAGTEGRWSPEARRSAGAIYSRSMHVSGPEREGSREFRGGEGVPRTYGHEGSHQLEEHHSAGDSGWSVPSQRSASHPATMMRENREGWGRQFAGTDRPFRNEILSSPTVPRSSFPGAGGGRQVYSAKPSMPLGEGWQVNQGMGGFSGGCRGRC